LYTEADGLWVHLQREAQPFYELKSGIAYEGYRRLFSKAKETKETKEAEEAEEAKEAKEAEEERYSLVNKLTNGYIAILLTMTIRMKILAFEREFL